MSMSTFGNSPVDSIDTLHAATELQLLYFTRICLNLPSLWSPEIVITKKKNSTSEIVPWFHISALGFYFPALLPSNVCALLKKNL